MRISCTNGRVSLLLNPDSLTSIPFGFGPDHEPRTIDLADRKIQDEAELRKLVLAQFDHELYSNFTAAADVFIDERIKFFYKEFEYTRLPLETGKIYFNTYSSMLLTTYTSHFTNNESN